MNKPTLAVLNAKATAELLDVTESTLFNWRHTGRGPRYIKAGPRRILYTVKEIQRWLELNQVEPAAVTATE
jgi:predicted DNA-binding transcriptional regulator AlpA